MYEIKDKLDWIWLVLLNSRVNHWHESQDHQELEIDDSIIFLM